MLKGKTAVVTGGVRGIGRAIAETFCKNGANVVVCYASNHEAAAETEAALKEYGTEVRLVSGDVADPETAQKVADLIKSDFDGKVDILVNNAGMTRDRLMIKMKPEDFSKVVDVNLNGAFYMTQALSSLMVKKRSGVIINMSSIAGIKGNPGQVNYAASKAGLVGMTLSAAKELGKRNIRVNGIAPGFIDTDMTAVLSDRQKEGAIANISLQRMGQPQDIANAALFLASDMSAYMTGQVIAIDGGIIM